MGITSLTYRIPQAGAVFQMCLTVRRFRKRGGSINAAHYSVLFFAAIRKRRGTLHRLITEGHIMFVTPMKPRGSPTHRPDELATLVDVPDLLATRTRRVEV
jgi:hypothetical protein